MGGIAGVEAWRPQRFTLFHRHFARQIERLGLQITATVCFGFGTQAVVAAPSQMYAPHVAMHFVKRWRAGHQGREMFVRRAPATAFNHKAVVLKRDAMRLKLADPAAMKGHHFLGALGDW
ncbi:hypothetical protein D3C78_1273770 [compost metagenome]